MALISASFTVRRGRAYAGMIADTSLYNVDGTCAANGEIQVGKVVAVDSVQPIEGHKVVSVANAAADKLLGVAVMSHAYSPEGVYEDGTAVNVLTHGRVWVLAEKAITDAQAAFDTLVTVNVNGVVAATGGAIATGWKFTGEVLDTDDANYKIVKVQLLQSATAPAA